MGRKTAQLISLQEPYKKASFDTGAIYASPFLYLGLFQFWVFIQYVSGISYDSQATLRDFLVGVTFFLFSMHISRFRNNELSFLYASLVAIAVFQSLYGLSLIHI